VSDPTTVDQERLRFSQAVVAVGALGAFVFEAPVLNPLLAGVVLVAMGPAPARDVLAAPFDRWLAARVRHPDRERIGRARLVQVTAVLTLGTAGFWWLVGASGLGEVFGLIGAGAAALYATTGIVAFAAVVDAARSVRARRSRPRPRPRRGS
jgi:hypothetical protein